MLGMQLLTRHSEEGNSDGFGWIKADSLKFKFEDSKLKVPHMGWNTVNIKKEHPFCHDLDSTTRFYFVHSYYVSCDNKEDVLMTTNYGFEFASAIQKENIIGVQFHPEKSHKFGMKILKNFTELK